MSSNRIATRYARALFRLTGKDVKKADEILDALGPVKQLFEYTESSKILTSPIMPADLKTNLLNYGLELASAPQELKRFFSAVIDAGRVSLVPQIISAYEELLNEAKGLVLAEITSAVELSSDHVSEIRKILGESTGKSIKTDLKVEPSILGGFVIQVGNLLIDSSIKTRLNALAETAVQ